MEIGAAFDGLAFLGERDASLGDDFVELINGGDMLVDDGLVDERPQRLRRLQFRRVGREKDEPHAVENSQPRFAMPASVVDHENDGSVNASAGFTRKKVSSSASKNGFDTPSNKYQKVSPVAGDTKAVT